MTLQEIIKSLDDLSEQDRVSLFNMLRLKLSQTSEEEKNTFKLFFHEFISV